MGRTRSRRTGKTFEMLILEGAQAGLKLDNDFEKTRNYKKSLRQLWMQKKLLVMTKGK